ncbi:MAG: substrate-binding domain-containing protein, partial [Chloroflexota bacterium]
MAKLISSKRATIHDVAERAGVSYQTVSRVLNDHPSVAEATRARVNEAIKALNYYPNSAARDLAARQSRLIGVISCNLADYGPTQMLINVEQSARRAGYDLIFANVDPTNRKSTAAAADLIRRWSVAGVIILAPVRSAAYDHMLRQLENIPHVQLDVPKTDSPTEPSVIIDQFIGIQLVTEHLIGLGHTRIATIAMSDIWFSADARLKGYQATMRDAGLEPLIIGSGDWSSMSGYAVMKAWGSKLDFTALVVANDQMALGAIYALQEMGLRVPHDISVTGFDDVPESRFFSPALTTVRQDFSLLGLRGLEYL